MMEYILNDVGLDDELLSDAKLLVRILAQLTSRINTATGIFLPYNYGVG